MFVPILSEIEGNKDMQDLHEKTPNVVSVDPKREDFFAENADDRNEVARGISDDILRMNS